MLTVHDLKVRYGSVMALRGVDFHVDAGQIVSVVGPNGAGKTSALAAIAGILPIVGGTVTVDGVPITGEEPETIVRRGVALVPEGRHVFGSLTVEENLRIGATIRKSRSEIESDIDLQLDRFPVLRRYLRSTAGNLSGGEQQQLVIARALLGRPRLLLMDEPSLGLAPFLVDMVFDIITELRELGVTILLVEQNALRAIALADRSYVLVKGKIVASGTQADFQNHDHIVSLYLGAEHTQ